MRIKVVGKVHRSGTSSKTGKNYNFVELHAVLPKRGVIGEAAQTITMDPEIYPFDRIAPGVYDADFDNSGSLLSLSPAQVQHSVNK